MQELHKQAIRLLDKIRSYIDTDTTATADLKKQAQRLIDDFEQNKNARSLEDQVKRISDIANRLDDSEMDHQHSDDIKDICQDLCSDLRKLQ